MEKIESFNEVLRHLQDGDAVCTINNGKVTYYFYSHGKIFITSDTLNTSIPPKHFQQLYDKENFYLYTNEDEEIDLAKDEEYYSWKGKGVN